MKLVLAVVLRNQGFADATSISGSLDLPSGFRAIVTPEDVDSDTALASLQWNSEGRSDVYPLLSR